MGIDGVHTIYCIGDNPETDIYGGNLYARYLHKRHQQKQTQSTEAIPAAPSIKKKLRLAQVDGEYISDEEDEEELQDPTVGIESTLPTSEESAEDVVGEIARQVVLTAEEEASSNGLYTQKCESILVSTGVFSKDMDLFSQRSSNHNHRDFVIDPDLKQPTHMVAHVLDAVRLVMEKEGGVVSGVMDNKV
nr:hypothetical protein BaRGS_017291 [Batillaria attramentaria]